MNHADPRCNQEGEVWIAALPLAQGLFALTNGETSKDDRIKVCIRLDDAPSRNQTHCAAGGALHFANESGDGRGAARCVCCP